MPCKSYRASGGGTVIVCSRSRGRPGPCDVCGSRPHARLCDGPGDTRGTTCDAKICLACAYSVPGWDLDYCPLHRPADAPGEPSGRAQDDRSAKDEGARRQEKPRRLKRPSAPPGPGAVSATNPLAVPTPGLRIEPRATCPGCGGPAAGRCATCSILAGMGLDGDRDG